jgi:hypothetical protein
VGRKSDAERLKEAKKILEELKPLLTNIRPSSWRNTIMARIDALLAEPD